MAQHRIFTMPFGRVYPCLVAKAERKGRTRAEVDRIIRWFTGYTSRSLAVRIRDGTDVETFFTCAPRLHPSRTLITGVVCGVRVEEVADPTMREIRRLDKLIDELAKGRPLTAILRKPPARAAGSTVSRAARG